MKGLVIDRPRTGRLAPNEPETCAAAAEFAVWVTQLLAPLEANPTPAAIILAKSDLVDRYFDYRARVGKAHRDHVSAAGHLCVWHAFEAGINTIRELELRIPSRSLIFHRPATNAMPQEVFLGTVIGDDDADE